MFEFTLLDKRSSLTYQLNRISQRRGNLLKVVGITEFNSIGEAMSGERYTIQELGGAELAAHYPDRGPPAETNSYNSVLQTDPKVEGILGWLASFRYCTSFAAVLSANAVGLRILVTMDDFAVFIPWEESEVSAERSWPATTVHLKTTALPKLTLVFTLDDEAADDLFRQVIPPLEQRDPPRALWWGPGWPLGWLVATVAAVSAGLIGWLAWRVM
jgi:hypothetical protein